MGKIYHRVVAQTVNLFARSSIQFGISVVAHHSAAAQPCGRGASPSTDDKIKRTSLDKVFVLFPNGALVSGHSTRAIKKRTLFAFFFWRLLRDSDPRHFG